jgi:hypothetical protein
MRHTFRDVIQGSIIAGGRAQPTEQLAQVDSSWPSLSSDVSVPETPAGTGEYFSNKTHDASKSSLYILSFK